MAWYSLTDDSKSEEMKGVANQMRGQMGELARDMEAGYDKLSEETLKPFEDEAATLRRKRGFRDPLAEFAMQSGLRAQQQGASAKAAQATGLRGAGAFAQGQIAQQAAVQGYQMETSRRAQEAQRNSAALSSILSQKGQIQGNMGMAQLQAVGGIRSQQVMGHAQMMSQAAQMADQPTFFGGAMQGVIQAGATALFASDRRLKKNIEHVGVSANGHNVYEFEYKVGSGKRFRGVMADEVPFAAFATDSGYAAVDYNHPNLDVAFEEVN